MASVPDGLSPAQPSSTKSLKWFVAIHHCFFQMTPLALVHSLYVLDCTLRLIVAFVSSF